MADAAEVTPEEQLVHLADLVAEVRGEYRYALATFEAVVEGVELAAEQVQDKRLELLETAPDVSLGEALLSALLVFGVHAGTAARFTSKAITSVHTAVVTARRTRAFEAAMDRIARGFDWRTAIKEESPAFAELSRVVTTSLGRSLEADRTALDQTRRFVEFVANRVGDTIGAGVKTARDKVSPHLKSGSPAPGADPGTFWNAGAFGPNLPPGRRRLVQRRFDPRQGGDSPGVAFRQMWRTAYHHIAFLVDETLGQVERDLLVCTITRAQDRIDLLFEDVLALHEAVRQLNELQRPLDDVRIEAFQLYEKAIWMLLYGDGLQVRPGIVHDPVEDDRLLLGVPQPLVRYWWGRFPDPVTGLPFPSQPALFEHLMTTVADALRRLVKAREVVVAKATSEE